MSTKDGPDHVSGPKVFVSYAHDSADHKHQVLAFAELLIRNGTEVELDQWGTGRRQDWGSWAIQHISQADFVIIVASEDYRRVGDGFGPAQRNRGVQSEAAIIRDLLHRDRTTWLPRLLPVLLPGHDVDEIPEFLQPNSADHYRIPELTDEGVEDLLRVLTGQPSRARPAVGRVPILPPYPPALRQDVCHVSRPAAGGLESLAVSSEGTPSYAAAELRWQHLPRTVEVTWRSDLMANGWTHPSRATLEVHLVPVGNDTRLLVSLLQKMAARLASFGRERSLFTVDEQLDIGWSDRAAWASSHNVRERTAAGLAVHRSGQRSAWRSLPSGPWGAVLEQDDLAERLTKLLSMLTSLDLSTPTTLVPAVAIEPLTMIREGRMSDLNSSAAQLRMLQAENIRLPGEDTLTFEEVHRSAEAVAVELAARLLTAFRGAR